MIRFVAWLCFPPPWSQPPKPVPGSGQVPAGNPAAIWSNFGWTALIRWSVAGCKEDVMGGWPAGPASRELSELLLACFEGQSLCLLLFFLPPPNLLKILKIQRAGSGQGGGKKKLLCHTTSPWNQKHPGSFGGACPSDAVLYSFRGGTFSVSRASWGLEPPPPSTLPTSGLLVMQGFWLQEVGWCVSREGFLSL